MVNIATTKLVGHTLEFRGGNICFVVVPELDADLSKLLLEEILEVASGHVRLEEYLQQQADLFGGETVILDENIL
jgi:hypothetical protein